MRKGPNPGVCGLPPRSAGRSTLCQHRRWGIRLSLRIFFCKVGGIFLTLLKTACAVSQNPRTRAPLLMPQTRARTGAQLHRRPFPAGDACSHDGKLGWFIHPFGALSIHGSASTAVAAEHNSRTTSTMPDRRPGHRWHGQVHAGLEPQRGEAPVWYPEPDRNIAHPALAGKPGTRARLSCARGSWSDAARTACAKVLMAVVAAGVKVACGTSVRQAYVAEGRTDVNVGESLNSLLGHNRD